MGHHCHLLTQPNTSTRLLWQLCSTTWRAASAHLVVLNADWLTKGVYTNNASFLGPCWTSMRGQHWSAGFSELALRLHALLSQGTFWAGLVENSGRDHLLLAKATSKKTKYLVGVAQFPWNSWQNCEEQKKKRRPKKRRRNFEFPISVFSFPLEWRAHTSGETKPAVVYIAALFDGVLTSKMTSVHGFNISQRAVILMQSISEALEWSLQHCQSRTITDHQLEKILQCWNAPGQCYGQDIFHYFQLGLFWKRCFTRSFRFSLLCSNLEGKQEVEMLAFPLGWKSDFPKSFSNSLG